MTPAPAMCSEIGTPAPGYCEDRTDAGLGPPCPHLPKAAPQSTKRFWGGSTQAPGQTVSSSPGGLMGQGPGPSVDKASSIPFLPKEWVAFRDKDQETLLCSPVAQAASAGLKA